LWRALCHLLLVDDTSDVFSDPIDDEPTEQVDHDQKHNVDEKEDRPSSRVQEGDSHHQEQLQEQVEHRQDRTLTMTTTLTGLISHSSAIFSGGRSVMDISSLPLLSDKDGRRRQDGGFDSTSQVSAPMLVCTDGLKVHRSGGIKTTGGNLRRDLYKRSLHRRRHHQQHYSGGGTFDSQTSAPVGGGSFCTVTKHGSTATIAGLNSRQQHVQSSRESFDGTSLGTAATGTADKSSEAAMQMRVARSAEVVNGTKRSMEVGRMAARQNAQQRLGRADFFDGNDGASLVSAVSAALLAGSRSDTLGVVDCARSFASAPQDGDPDLLLRVGRTFPETGNIIYRKRSVTASTIHHPFSQHLLSRRSIQQHQEALPHDGGDGWTMVVAPDEVHKHTLLFNYSPILGSTSNDFYIYESDFY
jgi:hypothetical protein